MTSCEPLRKRKRQDTVTERQKGNIHLKISSIRRWTVVGIFCVKKYSNYVAAPLWLKNNPVFLVS